MNDRTELFEAALDRFLDGIALLGEDGRVVFWNRAAEAITGYISFELVGRLSPDALDSLLHRGELKKDRAENSESIEERGTLAHAHHRLGHDVPVIARYLSLRDGLGGHIGTAIAFHPAESLDALPLGECGECEDVTKDQAEFQERLSVEFDDFLHGGPPFGVLWIMVDQAHELRKSHGANPCEAMLEKVNRALTQGLRPTEKLGRWGDDEFLVISHERTPEMLSVHAQTLAGLARTAEFRWWGDRISLTVSIGAAQAERNKSLADLLDRAQSAMSSSFHAGGNQITHAPEGHSCSPS